LGFNEHYKELFSEMKSVMAKDPKSIRKKGMKIKEEILTAKADAVTSATITSAAIFRGLNEGRVTFKELKKKGLIQVVIT
jgi:hypothetical protein